MSRRIAWIASTLCGVMMSFGCGRPPVDGPFFGEPIFEVWLHVVRAEFAPPTLRTTVLWTVDGVDWLEQPYMPAPRELAYDGMLRLFEPPPFGPDVPATGRVVVHDDQDRDGVWQAGESILGAADYALVWIPGGGHRLAHGAAVCCAFDIEACGAACGGDGCDVERIRMALDIDYEEARCGTD